MFTNDTKFVIYFALLVVTMFFICHVIKDILIHLGDDPTVAMLKVAAGVFALVGAIMIYIDQFT